MDRFESPPEPPPRRRDARGRTRWSAWNFVGVAAVLLGVGLALLGVNRALAPEEPAEEAVRVPIRTVAPNVPDDATATAASGQQRLVRTSRGNLLVLFASDDGLAITSDGSNQGRAWRTPVTLPAISPRTFSVDIDERDRMHLAFGGEDGVFYATLRQTATGWTSGTLLELDDFTSEIVDIAYDGTRQIAHVVWAAQDDGGRVPRWAAIDASEEPLVLSEDELAEGGDAGVAVNVAAGGDGTVVATYRRGDSPEGWFARAIGRDAEVVAWGPEESLDIEAVVSAASLTVDPRGVAHLILAEEGGSRLEYLRRARRAGWIAAEAAITPGVTDPIDRPSVTVDTTSRLLYLFFRTSGPDDVVRVAIRDPVGGWEGPYRIGIGEEVAADVVHPAAPKTTEGHPMVIWTTTGASPSIEAARIIAP